LAAALRTLVHVLEGGDLDVVAVAPRSEVADEFGLVQADGGFGQSVVVGVADRPDRTATRKRTPPSPVPATSSTVLTLSTTPWPTCSPTVRSWPAQPTVSMYRSVVDQPETCPSFGKVGEVLRDEGEWRPQTIHTPAER
jgi:hypothetical protein